MVDFFERFERESLFEHIDAERWHRLGVWGETSLGDLLDYQVDRQPETVAVTDDDRSLTWGDLRAAADGFAAGLHERGVERGDRVGLQLPNVVEWYVARLGIFRAGGVTATLLPRYRERELSHVVETVEPTAYVGPTSYGEYAHVDTVLDLRDDVDSLDHVVALGAPTPAGAESFEAVVDTETKGFTPDGIHPDYPDRLRNTGGTTGLPKPMYWSHNMRASWIRPILDWYGITGYDQVMGMAPFPHGISTPWCFTGSLLTGASATLTDPSNDPETLWERLADDRPSVVTAAPTQLNKMRGVEGADDHALKGVKLIVFSGESLPRETATYFEERGPTVVSFYGVTEGGAAFAVHPREPESVRRASAGKPIPFVDGKVVDDDWTALETGEYGELVWSGPNLAYGFYDNPEANEEVYEVDDEGTLWVHSGDVAALDGTGHVDLQGRVDDMILRGGQNVFPPAIEDEIATLDGVEEVAIVGMPDPEYGQRSCAFVVATGPLSLPDVIAHLDERGLAKYKWPERLEQVDELPKTAARKVDKKVLEERIRDALREEGALE